MTVQICLYRREICKKKTCKNTKLPISLIMNPKNKNKEMRNDE